MIDSPQKRLKRKGDLIILSPDSKQARDELRRPLWEPSSKTSNNAILSASHAGIDSSEQTSLHSTESYEFRGSLSVKPPKSSRFPARLFKPGGCGMTPSICVPTLPTSFRAVPAWRSYTAS